MTTQRYPRTDDYVRIIESAYHNAPRTVFEMGVAAGTGNPTHYHEQFAETFEILEGELLVGLGHEQLVLTAGGRVTVRPRQAHWFKNVSGQFVRVLVTIAPANRNFEDAMRIYKGLARDGFANASGVPRNLSDLALFLRLNDSHLVGLAKVAEPVFRFLARRATQNGRLNELRRRYCS